MKGGDVFKSNHISNYCALNDIESCICTFQEQKKTPIENIYINPFNNNEFLSDKSSYISLFSFVQFIQILFVRWTTLLTYLYLWPIEYDHERLPKTR